MNQGRIWCVVHPTVGLPLLLGSVAATSLIVHACVLTHTGWFSNYWAGSSRTRTSAIENPAKVASATTSAMPGFSITVSPVAGTQGKAETAFVVTVSPSTVSPSTGSRTAANVSAGATDAAPHPTGPLALAAPAVR